MNLKRKYQAAVTLIELLIVVAIISILAAIAVPNFLEAQVRSKVSRTKQDLAFIAVALEAYFADYKLYPQVPHLVEIPEKKSLTEEEFKKYFMEVKAEEKETTPVQPLIPPEIPPEFISELPFLPPKKGLREINPPLYALQKFFERKEEALKEIKSRKLEKEPQLLPPEIFMGIPYEEKAWAGFARQFAQRPFQIVNQDVNSPALFALTTPIAYIHSESLSDPFHTIKLHPFGYVNFTQLNPDGVLVPRLSRNMLYGVISFGPDSVFTYLNLTEPLFEVYDPTNGTVSNGDIIRWSENIEY